MDWKPIELTEKDKEWIEVQEETRNAILHAFDIKAPSVGATEKPELTQKQKNLIRGMQVCAEVARLYKQRGKPPKWTKRVEIEPGKFAWAKDENWENVSRSRAYRRSIRFSLNKRPADQYACGTCGLPFIGPTTGRCQCKPVVLKKQQNLERAKKLAAKMQEAAREAA